MLGQHTKRPDVVLYVNGIALVTLELKRSYVAVSEGIRQTIGNQQPEFIRPFFTTVQLVMAGNDVEGLRYAVIDTPEKYWLNGAYHGHRPATRARSSNPLDRGSLDPALVLLAAKDRLLEIVHDFMVFDAGVKKTCRHNQYFGVKAAQERVQAARGRHHLAHPGLGQVAHDGVAGQVDPRAPAGRPRPAHHRPDRTG